MSEHGHTDEALTVRRERHVLVFLECKDALLDLYILLCDHNLDALSINEAQSVISEAAAKPPSERSTVQHHDNSNVRTEEPTTGLSDRDTTVHQSQISSARQVQGEQISRTHLLDSSIPHRQSASPIQNFRPRSPLIAEDYYDPRQQRRFFFDIPPSNTQTQHQYEERRRYESSAYRNPPSYTSKNVDYIEPLSNDNYRYQEPTQNMRRGHPYSSIHPPNRDLSSAAGNLWAPPSYSQPYHYHPVNYSNGIDPHTRHMMKQNLLSGTGERFSGDPQQFTPWKINLQRRIEECGADSFDVINIILANTTGRPKSMVQSFLNAGITNPDTTLREIWHTIEYRIGTSERTSESLIK